jgi:5-methylcytosine-specific restriction endonuclease McrA
MIDKYGRFVKGHKLSEATIRKMKGRIPWNKGCGDYMSGKNNPFFGKHHTTESKERNRSAHLGHTSNDKQKEALRLGQLSRKGKSAPWARRNPQVYKPGSEHPNWCGGTKSWRGSDWKKIREDIKKRDDNKCVKCKTPKLISVHHIIPYRVSKNNKPENLETLCRGCHCKKDRNYIQIEKNIKEVREYAAQQIAVVV